MSRRQRKFSVIYTDPPWPWNDSGVGFHATNSAENYDIASMEELWSMDVRAVAADDAVMFMWVLNGFLEPSILTMARWGFTLRTVAFIWVKTYDEPREVPRVHKTIEIRPRNNRSPWTLPGAELLLVGGRGGVSKVVQMHSGIKQVQYAPVVKHSHKPQLFRDLIVQMTPTVRPRDRLEMFARGKIPGWTTFGNQADGGVQLPSCSWEMPA